MGLVGGAQGRGLKIRSGPATLQFSSEAVWPSRGGAGASGPKWGALAGTSNSPAVTHTAALLLPIEEQSYLSFLLLLEIIIFCYKSYLFVKGLSPQKCRREKMKALFHLPPQLLLPPECACEQAQMHASGIFPTYLQSSVCLCVCVRVRACACVCSPSVKNMDSGTGPPWFQPQLHSCGTGQFTQPPGASVSPSVYRAGSFQGLNELKPMKHIEH